MTRESEQEPETYGSVSGRVTKLTSNAVSCVESSPSYVLWHDYGAVLDCGLSTMGALDINLLGDQMPRWEAPKSLSKLIWSGQYRKRCNIRGTAHTKLLQRAVELLVKEGLH